MVGIFLVQLNINQIFIHLTLNRMHGKFNSNIVEVQHSLLVDQT